MIEFADGPAEGVKLELRRAPLFLRVVRDRDGKYDALDQLDDTPAPGEGVIVYRLIGKAQWYHVLRRGRGTRSGWFVCATYELPGEQPVGVVFDTGKWRAWCTEQAKAFLPEATDGKAAIDRPAGDGAPQVEGSEGAGPRDVQQ